MTQQTLLSNKTSNLTIDIIKINDSLCAFKAEYKTDVNGVSKIETSEGINTLSKIQQAQSKCTLPIANKAYILKSDTLLELVRQFGHPSTLSDDMTFNSSDIQPLILMKEEIELNQISFLDAKNKDILDDLIYIHYSNHVIVDIKNNTLINTAQHSENLNLNEHKYKNYRQMIEKLIADKRINIIDKHSLRSELFETYYDSDFEYVSAKIVFSNEEFKSLINPTYIKEQHINNWVFQKDITKHDFLNIKEYIKTQEEIKEDEDKFNS